MSGPWRFSPLASGTNNLVQVVETPDLDRYVLRIHGPHRDITHVRYELATVTALRESHLPFLVPTPIPTTSGETVVRVPADDGELLATLWPFIPGSHPREHDLDQASAAGQALAELDDALAQVRVPATPDAVARLAYGDLGRYPLVDDQRAVLTRLPLDQDSIARLLELVDRARLTIPLLYGALPRQIIHSDFDGSNVLLEGNRVTGVVDFEFSHTDLRALDLVIALWWWTASSLGSGSEWEIADAFGRAYVSRQPFLPAEVEALPSLFQFRSATSLLHGVGRYAQGFASEASLQRRVERIIAWEDWLTAHGAALVWRARGWHAT
jgi:homoserine kinase type II